MPRYLALVALCGWTHDASACGATPQEVYPLLPVEGQMEVPLNAVLSVAAGDTRGAVIELRVAGTEELLEVALDRCTGRVCTGTPLALLENTEYEYRGTVDYQDDSSEWTTFTTGASSSDARLDSVTVTASVLSASPKLPPLDESEYPCGYSRNAQIEFGVEADELPLAIVDAIQGPDFFRPPLVLSQEMTGVLDLHDSPDCFVPLVIDTLGNRIKLDEVCLPGDESTEAMGGSGGSSSDAAGDQPTAGTETSAQSPDSGGCSWRNSVTPGGGSAFWVLLGLGVAGLHRRRSSQK